MTATPAQPDVGRLELTFRGLALGGLITLLFTAANVYLGLKVGLTFATSIPAAVISMALLRMLQEFVSIYENNIVQIGRIGGGGAWLRWCSCCPPW